MSLRIPIYRGYFPNALKSKVGFFNIVILLIIFLLDEVEGGEGEGTKYLNHISKLYSLVFSFFSLFILYATNWDLDLVTSD